MLYELLEMLGPVIVAALTVPIMQGLKAVSSWLDNAHTLIKQTCVILIAWGLTLLGGWAEVVLPESISLFTETDVEGLLSAVLAMAIHTGKAKSG